jgi:hypothetical protein
MKWLILSWAITAGMIPFGYETVTTPASRASVEPPEQASYVDISLDARVLKYMKIYGGAESYMFPSDQGSLLFCPYRVDYSIGAAFVIGPFEAGVWHECDHSIRQKGVDQFFESGETMIYLTLRGKTEF